MRVLFGWLVLSTALLGCEGGKDGANATGPELAVSPLELDFGVVGVGESADQLITVSNAGGGTLDVLSVTLTEGKPSLWFVEGGAVALGAGEEAEFMLSFSPRSEGLLVGARVQVRAADLDGVEVRASGTGGSSNADNDGDGVTVAQGDCDDNDADVYPGAAERCNGRDDDCANGVPANEADADGDGVRICEDDCDDGNGSVYPDAVEACDGLDTDCDGINQDNQDADGDGASVCDGDCNDQSSAVTPGKAEVCDGLDNDCDGTADNLDADNDGHLACGPAADCDDGDAAAHPVVLSTSGRAGGAGTAADPVDTLSEAVGMVGGSCPRVLIQPGSYAASVSGAPVMELRGLGSAASDVVLDASGSTRALDLGAGADLVLRKLTVSGGQRSSSGGCGRVTGGRLQLVDMRFMDCHSDDEGGALAVPGGRVELGAGVHFMNNSALNGGGAVSVRGGVWLDQAGTHFEGNEAGDGGAIFAVSSDVQVATALFDGNVASGSGGAVYFQGTGSSGLKLEANQLWRNQADGLGGAVALHGAVLSQTGFRNNWFQDNFAELGGGGLSVDGDGTSSLVTNNTFHANGSTGEGASVYVDPEGSFTFSFENNILGWSDGLSAYFTPDGETSDADFNIAFGTAAGAANDFVNAVGGSNLSDTDPRFVSATRNGDPSDDDLSLQASSPARNAGRDVASLNDLDGSRNDMGATGGPGAR